MTNESKHTSEPWEVEQVRKDMARIWYEPNTRIGKMLIAEVHNTDKRFSSNYKHVQLIAAAPELLEALEEAAGRLAQHHADIAVARKCFEIINKAKGGQ